MKKIGIIMTFVAAITFVSCGSMGGTVANTHYSGSLYSYCITYFLSPLFWVLGAPSGTSENELQVRFELVDRAGGKVLWRYDYCGRDSVTHWIYARVGAACSMYALLMKLAMNQALKDLSARMPN